MHKKITNKIKAINSKKKCRYKDGKYDLDLTYITKRVIAMGYPASSFLESMHRNDIKDVKLLHLNLVIIKRLLNFSMINIKIIIKYII